MKKLAVALIATAFAGGVAFTPISAQAKTDQTMQAPASGAQKEIKKSAQKAAAHKNAAQKTADRKTAHKRKAAAKAKKTQKTQKAA